MSCNICGKATGPGALLCRPCRSALKRARQFTMLEMPGTPPAVTMTGLPLDGPRRAAPVRRAPRPRRRRLRSWARLGLAGVAVVVVLGVGTYVGQTNDPARGALAMPRLGPAPKPVVAPDGVSNPERISDLVPARKEKGR